MYKNFSTTAMTVILMMSVIITTSCDEDDPAVPTIALSETAIDVKAEESISVTVTFQSEAGAKSITVSKLWDGEVQGTPEVSTGADLEGNLVFEYDVIQDDADHVLTFNFLIEDNEGQTGQVELVVNVELTSRQLLLKYNWLLSDEIRNKTGASDITDAYTDDIYRFNADGTFDKSIGAKADDFGDAWYNYCEWDLNETTNRLLMHRTGAFLANVVDTLDITMITSEAIEADVTYLGLDAFNTGNEDVPYEAVEAYVKKFTAQVKGDSFDPYKAGAEDDAGPAGTCNDVELVNE
ncbi:MAG: hypothetical protein ABJF04_04570 [Reichenbachiella sp.]|uniref:hypothetical protein n=1 Tax=Reichenbachiella sp. TaxID=2184521 RepID=UPI0032652B73